MKTYPSRTSGFTLFEAAIIVAILAVLAAMLLPLASNGSRSPRIHCISNLKQVGIGFRLFAGDNEGRFPTFPAKTEAWAYFQAAGDDLSSPRVLICPQDTDRSTRKAMDFDFSGSDASFAHSSHRNQALSYFFGLDANEASPDLILSGDRNLSTNRRIRTGLLAARTNAPPRWTADIHEGRGNILLADGSAHQVTDETFAEKLRAVTNEFQTFVLP